jgi:hypothetical protein
MGACLVLPGCCIILANGLRFQSSEAVLGSWLARELTGRSGGTIMKHFLKCILLLRLNDLAFIGTYCASAFKSARAFVHGLQC